MQIFFSVLSAMLTYRVIELVVAASVKTYKDYKASRILEKPKDRL